MRLLLVALVAIVGVATADKYYDEVNAWTSSSIAFSVLPQWCKQTVFVYANCTKKFPSSFGLGWKCPVLFSSQGDYQPSVQTDK